MSDVNSTSNAGQSALFTQYASDYALIESMFGLSAIYEGLARDVLSHLPAGRGGRRILDIGAGTGLNASFLLKANADVHVTLVDISADMLGYARHLLQPYADRTAFVAADINDYLPEAQERFEAVTSAFAIHNFHPDDRARLFSVMRRVLLPEAVFVAFDKYALADEKQHQQDLRLTTDKFREFTKKGRPDLEEQWREHYRADDAIRFTEEEQTRLLHKAGFTRVQWVMRKGLEATVCGLP